MKFMGSKARYAKEILPIILKDRVPNQWYVEPFVGGGNIIDKAIGPRIGGDVNQYIIAMFKAVQSGWIPPDSISELEYNDIKTRPKQYSQYLVGFVAIGCSYSGKWWGGYARGNTSDGRPRNYCLESKNNLLAQCNGLIDIDFRHSSYDQLFIPSNSIIYCDPPYRGTTGYKIKFNHDTFWSWCDDKISEGHKIFVSEYIAPPHWKCVWSKEVFNSLTKNTGSKRGIEKLFTR